MFKRISMAAAFHLVRRTRASVAFTGFPFCRLRCGFLGSSAARIVSRFRSASSFSSCFAASLSSHSFSASSLFSCFAVCLFSHLRSDSSLEALILRWLAISGCLNRSCCDLPDFDRKQRVQASHPNGKAASDGVLLPALQHGACHSSLCTRSNVVLQSRHLKIMSRKLCVAARWFFRSLVVLNTTEHLGHWCLSAGSSRMIPCSSSPTLFVIGRLQSQTRFRFR